MMATPSAFSRAISPNSNSVSRSESAAVGSSMTRMRAFWLIALAISTICCCATPSLWTAIEGSMSKPIESSTRLASAQDPATVDSAGHAAFRLAAEEDVLRDIEMGNKREFLKDHGDAELLGIGGRRNGDPLALVD